MQIRVTRCSYFPAKMLQFSSTFFANLQKFGAFYAQILQKLCLFFYKNSDFGIFRNFLGSLRLDSLVALLKICKCALKARW